ncbi:CHAT domain-containing protein [Frankia sp. AgB32]|uniref:CHAT domain-containing protein n=1 Tax=Frankia sp. AgB32 TaxID=631119 RepID=UPI00200E5DC7|nr:CHAT domain-containing protein [Frankia sp. AgB32]MCK9896622.1 CHAT domain-containing protein [Frankia sp. AgB32]
MTIPRILVDVARRGDGWAVRVHGYGDGPPAGVDPVDVRSEHEMAAVMVTDVDDSPRQVPAVPAVRLGQLAGDLPASLASLCRGDAEAVHGLLVRVAGLDLRPGDAELYGRWLFECLLAPVWPAILRAAGGHGPGHGHGVELALRWPAGDRALDSLVWESMHDGAAPLLGHPLILIAVTRVVPATTPAPATIRRVPRVLFAAGSALDEAVIRPGAMFMGLVRAFEAEGLCVSRLLDRVTITELGEACARHAPDVVHLVAHGDVAHGDVAHGDVAHGDGEGWDDAGEHAARDRPVIRLADKPVGARRGDPPTGSRYVDAEALALALRGPAGMPAVVVLSACGSALPAPAGGADAGGSGGVARVAGRSMAAELVERGVPIVVAMSGEVSEQASRMFARGFVRAVHEGASVVAAATAGRRAALLHGDPPSGYLDWAMPTLLLAENVPPDLRLVDPEPVARLRHVAESLELRHAPMFIGHEAILDAVEDLAGPAVGGGPGLLAAVAERSIRGLGGTRLLRETGLRLLRRGHLPLLVGPFGDGAAPQDVGAVVVQILAKMISVASALRMDPSSLTVLGADPAETPPGNVAGGYPPALDEHARLLRIARLQGAVDRFAASPSPYGPETLRALLRIDLAAFAGAAAALGEPFGPESRVVVLGDEVHRWAGALAPLLALINRDGLGEPGRPVPVVVTASLVGGAGEVLKRRRDALAGQPGYLFPELAPLSPASAILGFQWILLHPWRPDFPLVYAAARGASREQIERNIGLLRRMPTAVRESLYLIAASMEIGGILVGADDEQALRIYEEQFQ